MQTTLASASHVPVTSPQCSITTAVRVGRYECQHLPRCVDFGGAWCLAISRWRSTEKRAAHGLPVEAGDAWMTAVYPSTLSGEGARLPWTVSGHRPW